MCRKKIKKYVALLMAATLSLTQVQLLCAEPYENETTGAVTESTVEMQTVSADSVSGNVLSENGVSGNALSENEASGNETISDGETKEIISVEEDGKDEAVEEASESEDAVGNEKTGDAVSEDETPVNEIYDEPFSAGFAGNEQETETLELFGEIASQSEDEIQYVENEAVFIADTEEKALETAEKLGATLKEYSEYGVAVVKFEEQRGDTDQPFSRQPFV